MKRKLIAVMMALLLLGSLAACAAQPAGTQQPAQTGESTGTQQPAQTEETAGTEQPAEMEEPAGTEEPAETEQPAEAGEPAETEEPAGTEDGQNPVMNFIGLYRCDRASIQVEASGSRDAKLTVTWGSSAFENSLWEMSGPFDEASCSVAYDNCVRTNRVFNENGEIEEETVVYKNGRGFVYFDYEDNSLTWEDDEEQMGEGMFFTAGESYSEDEDYYVVATNKSKDEVERFALSIKDDCFNENWSALTEKMAYPIDLLPGRSFADRESALAFLESRTLRQEFLDALAAELCTDMFANSYGVSMADGIVWFAEIDGELKIISFTGVAGEETDTAAFLGTWVCGRAVLDIARVDEEAFKCCLSWSGSASELARWEYDCYFDGSSLYSFETGVCREITYEPGEEEDTYTVTAETLYTDGAVSFTLTDEGKLLWNDYKEDRGDGMEFEHTERLLPLPTEQELNEELFAVVNSYAPGTAGASMGLAVASEGALRFCARHPLWCLDRDALAAAVSAARDGLSAEEQVHFSESLEAVAGMIEAARADWGGVSALFADAGANEMPGFLLDPMTLLSWDILLDMARNVD